MRVLRNVTTALATALLSAVPAPSQQAARDITVVRSVERDQWQQQIELAERLQEEHRFDEARAILLHAMEDASKSDRKDHRLAYTLNNLASVAQDEGQYLEAQRYYQKAVAYWRHGGEQSLPGLARTLNNLASLLDTADKSGEAQELLRQSEAIQVRQLATSQDVEPGIILLNRGSTYLKQRRFGESEEAYRRAWAILETHRESRELDLALSAAGLGIICDQTGRKEEALSHYAFAGTVWNRHVRSGNAGPEVFLNLAGVYARLRDDYAAERVLQEGLIVAERELGSEHPRRAEMLLLYANVLRHTGRKAEAGRTEKEAKSIRMHSDERLVRHTIAVTDLVRQEETR